MGTQNRQRIDHIDSIRGIAALLVVYLHTANYFMDIPSVAAQGGLLRELSYQLDFGRVGVLAFFAISGFVICPSLKGERRSGVRRFFVSRFFRLFPAFWTAMLLTLLVKYLWFGKDVDAFQVLGNIPMLYSFVGVEPLQGLYWTLEVELVFYFLCLALFLLGWLHQPFALFLLGLVFMGASTWIFTTPEVKYAIKDTLSIHWAFLPWNLAIMLWGGLFRIWYDDRRRRVTVAGRNVPLVGLVATLLIAILLRPLVLSVTWVVEGKYWALHEMVPYFLGLGLFIVGALYIRLTNRFLVWLGTVSYSIYLLHPIAYRALHKILLAWEGNWLSHHLGVYLLVCLMASILLAGAVYFLIEKPAIRLGRRLQGGGSHARHSLR